MNEKEIKTILEINKIKEMKLKNQIMILKLQDEDKAYDNLLDKKQLELDYQRLKIKIKVKE